MRKLDLHFGQEVLLYQLDVTERVTGSCSELRDLVGKNVTIHSFDHWYSELIQIMHPFSGITHNIHMDDIKIINNKEPDNEVKVIKVEQGKKVIFDEKQLFI